MHEVLCRAEGPLILIAVEHEAPVRVMAIGHPNEIAALTGWIQARPERRALMRAALDAQDVPRAEAWNRQLGIFDDGIVEAYVRLARAEMRRERGEA